MSVNRPQSDKFKDAARKAGVKKPTTFVRLVCAVAMSAFFGVMLRWNVSRADHVELGLLAGPIVAAIWFFNGWFVRIIAAVALLGVMWFTAMMM